MNQISAGSLLDESEMLLQFPSSKPIYKVGWGEWASELWFVPEKGLYFEKGPFGSHESVCFRVCAFQDEKSAQLWKQQADDHWEKLSKFKPKE